MKARIVTVFALVIAALVSSPVSPAQQENAKSTKTPFKHRVFYYHPPKAPMTPEALDLVRSQAAASQTIPLWTYSTVAQDGKTYTGEMVGRSPFAHGHRSTTIPTYLVPVILTFSDSGDVFDPTVSDGACSPANESVIQLIQNSPLIGTPNFTINGVNVGVGQYLDEFQRANFWSLVGGTPYHTTFSTSPTVLAPVHLTVPAANGVTMSGLLLGLCMDTGQMDINWWDTELQTVIMPSLAAEGVGPANFPQFIFDSVAMYDTTVTNCCALGYHNSYLNGGVFQTYSVNEYDNSGYFGGDTSVMSHEMAEWMDDPNTSNPVPAWGAEGQVAAGTCQSNLEVGDPLSPGFTTPTNPFSITNTTTGVVYSLQELAFYSWFLGSKPSLGAGGLYSDNGTFTGYAKACPPGGTN